ncbi:MAG: PIN/TRAM domain-containing protein [Firmicutes bacterium]|nr:PIN/TRAM domain-containing protein [Bacillota bacterium]
MATVAVSRETVIIAVILGAVIGALSSPFFVRWIRETVTVILSYLHKMPISDIIAGAVGMVVGLLIAFLLTMSFPEHVPFVGDYLPVLITLLFGYIGMALFVRKREELFGLFNIGVPKGPVGTRGDGGNECYCLSPKILDTSVIIDGRIFDICQSGFIEGDLIVPGFVLEEIQHIADSADTLKRNRGRRGLDILNRMQKELPVEVRIVQRDYPDIAEVDSRIVQLARDMRGKVLTNDYNLNKVCELQGVEVLNINELANAVKPVVLPGEEMAVQVIKDGKEAGQGVAYLDDGTMIVVDGGRRHIGETVEVVVTSVLQTAAGRMIFAKPKVAAEKVAQA